MDLSIYQIAGILLAACHIVITIKAFQDEAFQGAMCLLVPFYIVYYGFRRLNMKGRSLFVWIYILAFGTYAWGIFRPAGGPDACALIQADEAQSLLGSPVGSGVREKRAAASGAAASSCTFTTTESPVRMVSVLYGTGCVELPSATGRMIASVGLRGLTDEAYVGRGELLARKGNICIGILTKGLTEGIDASVSREMLAKKMLARLPK